MATHFAVPEPPVVCRVRRHLSDGSTEVDTFMLPREGRTAAKIASEALFIGAVGPGHAVTIDGETFEWHGDNADSFYDQ